MFQNGRSITPISFATPCTDFFGILVIRALSFRLDVFLVARPPLPLIRCFSIQLLTRLFLPVFMDPFQLLGAVFCVILSPQALASTDMVTTEMVLDTDSFSHSSQTLSQEEGIPPIPLTFGTRSLGGIV